MVANPGPGPWAPGQIGPSADIQSANEKQTAVQYSLFGSGGGGGLLGGLLGGGGSNPGSGPLNLGGLLGGGPAQGGSSQPAVGVDIDLDGVIDGSIDVLTPGGDLIDIDLDILEGVGDEDGLAGIDIDLDGVTDAVINIGGGQAGDPQPGDLVNVDIDLDGLIDAVVEIGADGNLLQADLDLLGDLDDDLIGVDIDLDGLVDGVIDIGGRNTGPQAGGLVNVDLDLDGLIEGSVTIGADGKLVQADLDLLGGIGPGGLIGIDIDLDDIIDIVVDVGDDGGVPGGGGDPGGGGNPGGGNPGGGNPGGGNPGGGNPGGGNPGGGNPGGGNPGGGNPGGGGDPGGGGIVVVPPPGTVGFDLFRAYQEITRVSPTSPDAPRHEINLLSAIVKSVEQGLITLEQGIWRITGFADDTTSVATTSYQFFTGRLPREAGLDYLVNAPDTVNANDLNDAYFAQFNLGNRYINFSANLAIGGEGKAFFNANYGGLTFEQAVTKAYNEIIGFAEAQEAGYDTVAAVNDILSRKWYFYQVAEERIGGDIEAAAKAGLIGYLLAEAVKAEIGVYGEGNAKFLFDLADGDAAFQSSLETTYGPDTVAVLGQSPGSSTYDTLVV